MRLTIILSLLTVLMHSGAVIATMTTATPEQTRQAVIRAIQRLPPGNEAYRRYRLALPFGSPLFPADAQLALPPVPAALARWLALPAAERRHDLLITPDIDYYWPAESGRYSAQFLLHLHADNGGRTAIEVLQLHPTLHAGEKLHLLGRTGPGFYQDLRPAPPSASAEAHLRAFIAAALTQPE